MEKVQVKEKKYSSIPFNYERSSGSFLVVECQKLFHVDQLDTVEFRSLNLEKGLSQIKILIFIAAVCLFETQIFRNKDN